MAENEADDGAVPPELPPYTIDNHRASLNQLPDQFSLPATAMEGLDSVLAEDQASIFRVIQTILSTARAFLFICQNRTSTISFTNYQELCANSVSIDTSARMGLAPDVQVPEAFLDYRRARGMTNNQYDDQIAADTASTCQRNWTSAPDSIRDLLSPAGMMLLCFLGYHQAAPILDFIFAFSEDLPQFSNAWRDCHVDHSNLHIKLVVQRSVQRLRCQKQPFASPAHAVAHLAREANATLQQAIPAMFYGADVVGDVNHRAVSLQGRV